ncbi:glycosyltransferase family 2 protein [Candidatus Roizmanbacteria bacterium]|nr:glycosyltransferase family 2 protein [Candidatus Roizmanbacteria bacterium]
MKKKYSIIIPTYNGEKTITTLLEKVIFLIKNYTYEIIIIDSESKDSTVKIINSYIKKYSTIRLIKIKKKVFNHGSTRNLGVKLAKGEYLCFFSQDAYGKKNNREWFF